MAKGKRKEEQKGSRGGGRVWYKTQVKTQFNRAEGVTTGS